MKKILFGLTTCLVMVVAATNQLYAQASDEVASAAPVKNFITKFNAASIEKSISLSPVDVNTKALKYLKKMYTANDEQWSAAKDGVVARFIAGGKDNIIYFDKKGHWAGSLKTYQEDKMPGDIRKMVRQVYYDYKITRVQEIATIDDVPQPTYIVYIQMGNDFKLIRIANEEMDVYREYNIK